MVVWSYLRLNAVDTNRRLVIISFFFSSRRRHTSYWRDWSSDVCSSDLRHKRHARFTARDQHGLAPDGPVQRRRGGCDIGLGRDGVTGDLGQLLPIRGDQGGPAVNGEVLALGVDDHGLAQLFSSIDHGTDDARRKRTLGVV